VLGWQADKVWSDRYVPQIKQIVGLYLIGDSPMEEDRSRNTDLIVLGLDAVRIGCRIRKAEEYLEQYSDEFTIRTSRPNGNKTELAKIIEGWGDYFFYGFGAADGSLTRWGLGDLRVFRLWFMQCLARNGGRMPGREMRNHDGSSSFHVFKWSELPPQFCVGNSE